MAETLQIHDLTLDLSARRVFREGRNDTEEPAEEVELGKLTFDLFTALARAAPAALSTEDIVAQVWQSRAVSDETIQQRVSLLRRALGQTPEREYVQTVRGFGYRLATEPLRVAQERPQTESQPATADRPRRPQPLWLRLFLAAVAVLVILLLLTALAMVARQLKRWTPGAFSARPTIESETLARELPRPPDEGRGWI